MKHLLALLALLLLLPAAQANQLVEVEVDATSPIESLLTGGFDIAYIDPPTVQIVAWEGDLERLTAAGFSYHVVHEELEAFYRSRLDSELDDMGGYATFSEIQEWYATMKGNYPNLLSEIDTLGFSIEDRPLWAFKISNNPNTDEDEPELLLNGAIHAREVITPMILMNFCEHLCENYGTDGAITELVNNREIWVLPVINPDGYVHNEVSQPNGGGTWRKNKRRIDGTLRGVDLNRNWPAHWGMNDAGSSPDPESATYRGQSAGSEPETQAMMDFINDHEFRIIINYHSYSNLILYPYSHSMNAIPEDITIYEVMADSLNLTLGWNTGPAQALLYTVNGDAVDWQEEECDYRNFSFVPEVGGVMDGFWPASDRIQPLCDGQIEPLMFVLRAAGDVDAYNYPVAPAVTVPDTVGGSFAAEWVSQDDVPGNAPYTYDLIELEQPGTTDHVNPDLMVQHWEMNGFSVATDTVHSTPAAYYSGSGSSRTSSLVSTQWMEVQEDDTLSFNTWYSIEPGWDFAYVQVRTTDTLWVSIPGNITTEESYQGRNRGHGITGSERQWVRGEFPLDDFAGQSIKIRILYCTSWLVGEEGMYIDDIYPVEVFGTERLVLEGTSDLSTQVTCPDGIDQLTPVWYKVRTKDAQGQYSVWSDAAKTIMLPSAGVGDDLSMLPQTFGVSQMYPNPFNPSTSLSLTLPTAAQASIRVYNILGEEVALLQDGRLEGGVHRFTFNASAFASGVYFVRVDVPGELHEMKKVVYLR